MEVRIMTKTQRLISIALSGALLLSGFAIGRWTSPTTASATEKAAHSVTATHQLPTAYPSAANEDQSFYLSDYKTGYSDGYNASTTGVGTNIANSTRPGYNEGFKEGYANGYQTRVSPQPVQLSAFGNTTTEEVVPNRSRTRTSYRTTTRPVSYERRARSSKLKTALTIAAPAAIGAGIGALAGGKKGAGAGALIGGGGGALYHLFKNK
jgi:hypothetical protein